MDDFSRRPIRKDAAQPWWGTSCVTRALDENLAAFTLEHGRAAGGETFQDDRLTYAYTGERWLSRVASYDLDEEADAEIARLDLWFWRRRADVMWMLGPGSRPEDIGHRLLRTGARFVAEWAGMAALLSGLPPPAPVPPGLRFSVVEDASSLAVWCGVVADALGWSIPMESSLYSLMTPHLGEPRSPLSLHLAALRGDPVGAYMLCSAGGCVGIYYLGTLPEAQRQGIGSSLATHALHTARQMSEPHRLDQPFAGLLCPLSLLPFYRRFGFIEHCRYRAYRWSQRDGRLPLESLFSRLQRRLSPGASGPTRLAR